MTTAKSKKLSQLATNHSKLRHVCSRTWRNFYKEVVKKISSKNASVKTQQRDLYKLLFVFLVVTLCIGYGPLAVNLLKPKLLHSHLSLASSPPSTVAVVASNQEALSNGYFNYPSLGIRAPLDHSEANDPMNYQNWVGIRSMLNKGVAVLYQTSKFEDAPLVYVVGHSSDYNLANPYAYIFASLGQAQIGDTFRLTLGQNYEYKVIEKKVVRPDDVSQFNDLTPHDTTKQRLVLVTCWPIFTTNERLLVIGERIIVTSATGK